MKKKNCSPCVSVYAISIGMNIIKCCAEQLKINKKKNPHVAEKKLPKKETSK